MNSNKNSDVEKERAMLARKEKENNRMAEEAAKIPISNEEFTFSDLTAEELLLKKDAEEILARIDLLDKRLSDHKMSK